MPAPVDDSDLINEPLIDFDLEVQVDIKKGQFVLHPHEVPTEDDRTFVLPSCNAMLSVHVRVQLTDVVLSGRTPVSTFRGRTPQSDGKHHSGARRKTHKHKNDPENTIFLPALSIKVPPSFLARMNLDRT